MSGYPDQSSHQEEDSRPSSQPSPAMASSSYSPQQTINNIVGRRALMNSLGFPLRTLFQELDDSIPQGENPASPTVKEKENSIDSPRKEASLSPPTPQSPVSATETAISSNNSAKSPRQDGAIDAKHFNSLLKESRSPNFRTETSSVRPDVENQTVEAMGSRRGKAMRVESGAVRRAALRKVEIGLRVSELVLSVASFSVMAADKTSGWSGDYFDRYQEYRFCFSVNVIASAYSTFQVFSHLYYMIYERLIISRPLSYSIDFLIDQVLTYFLMSASSAAAACTDDWVLMFGSDKFTNMLILSVAMSFFAFFAFAINSVLSAYKCFSN